jgi:hypothetical protein
VVWLYLWLEVSGTKLELVRRYEAGCKGVAQQRCLTSDNVAVKEFGCRNEVAGSGRSRNRKVVK